MPPIIGVDGAFPAEQSGLVRTYTIDVTWGTNRGFIQARDFDILIVDTLTNP